MELGSLPQFRNRNIERASPHVEVTVPIAVTPVDALLGNTAVVRAADRVRIGGQERVDKRDEQLPQRVGTGLSEVFFEKLGRSDIECDGSKHRSFRDGFETSLEG